MLVVIKVNNAGIRDFGELCDKTPVNCALHFYGADHVLGQAGVQPGVNPFKQAFGVADYVGKDPVYLPYFFWGDCKGVVGTKVYQRI